MTTNQPDPSDFFMSTDILSDGSPVTKVPKWAIRSGTLRTNHPLRWALFDDGADSNRLSQDPEEAV